MSEKKNPKTSDQSPVVAPIPENLPEELLPLYDWWHASGRQTLIWVALALIAVGGIFAFKSVRASKVARANQEMVKAESLDELEDVVAKYGSTKAGNAARLRLAKAYFDALKYEEALDTYDQCLKRGLPDTFKAIGQLGRAHALEGLNRLDEALAAYRALEQSLTGHYLQPQSTIGVARVLALQGQRDEAKLILEDLKADKSEDAAWEMKIAMMENLVERYEPRAVRSLFDMADEAASTAEAPVVPALAAPESPTPPQE